MPRFVILLHETPPGYPRGTHYDLMLEQGDVLWTWALDDLPTPDRPITAERLHDHRRHYLDFEGAVSAGRGSVTRIDHGKYELLSQTASELRLRAIGSQIQGELTIKESAGTQRWCVSISTG